MYLTREEILPIALECGFGHCEVGCRMTELVNRIVSQVDLQVRLELAGSKYSEACSDHDARKSSPAPSARTSWQVLIAQLRGCHESEDPRA